MGTFQNAFNQFLGITAGGIGTARLLSNQKHANKQNALNLAESQEDKANKFNADVKAYEKEVNQNISDLGKDRQEVVNMIKQYGMESKEGQLARKAWQESLNRYKQTVEDLTTQMEELNTRKKILEERKSFVEKDLGKNSLSHIKLSEVKNPNEQNEIKAKAIKSVQAYRHGGKR